MDDRGNGGGCYDDGHNHSMDNSFDIPKRQRGDNRGDNDSAINYSRGPSFPPSFLSSS